MIIKKRCLLSVFYYSKDSIILLNLLRKHSALMHRHHKKPSHMILKSRLIALISSITYSIPLPYSLYAGKSYSIFCLSESFPDRYRNCLRPPHLLMPAANYSSKSASSIKPI